MNSNAVWIVGIAAVAGLAFYVITLKAAEKAAGGAAELAKVPFQAIGQVGEAVVNAVSRVGEPAYPPLQGDYTPELAAATGTSPSDWAWGK